MNPTKAQRSRRTAGTALLGLLSALLLVSAAPASAASGLTMTSPAGGARTDGTPTFGGATTEPLAPLTVKIYAGGAVTGSAALSIPATITLGTWTATVGSGEALGNGEYTAVAEQTNALLEPVTSEPPVTFTVDTEAPKVTINTPASLTNETMPPFSGTASEAGEVTVHVLEGSTEVASETTTAAAGAWSTSKLSKALATGKHGYTVYATEPSAIGNGPGESAHLPFTVDTEAPKVTIVAPASPSRNTTPSFTGTASEETEVTVHVLEGTKEVASASTTATGGTFSTGPLGTALPNGDRSYTAYATEKSGLKNEDGVSKSVSFEVDTEPPKVTIVGPATLSNKRTPSFSGTAAEATEVTVHIFEGSTEVASETTTAAAGKWSTSTLSSPLPKGDNSYTAEATEVSGLGNAPGESAKVTFAVDTEPPEVSISAPPSSSGNRTPSFSGTAGEATEVTVHVLKGSTEVAKASTTAAGGKWATSPLSKALETGKTGYTAYATEKSGLGNEEGVSKSVAFEVDTLPPKVTIVAPPSPSRNTTPSFSGTAGEETAVEVHVYEGLVEVAHASTTAAGGKWSTSALSKALAPGDGSYTADATETSGLGNAEGESETVAFVVDTLAPSVTITQPSSPSKNTTPGFSGTASEETEVTVHVFSGPTEVASASATAAGGKWSTSTLNKALELGDHTFTAYATEVSGLGNGEGTSKTVSFEVDTEPPPVTIVGPAARSANRTPSFSGTAGEATEVVVHVFEGEAEIADAVTTAAGGKWSTSTLSKELPAGRQSFTAYATEKSGLGNADGKSEKVVFEVDTEPPTVSITGPLTPSRNTTPSFSGSASEPTEVTVHILEGSTEVGKQSVTAAGGSWSLTLSKALATGKHSYTASASEKSALGNKEGVSKSVAFEVDTEPPKVLIVSSPPERSNSTTPAFSGTASEENEVKIHVFEGLTEVASATTTATGGKWSTSTLTKVLPEGRHSFTAYATEQSSLGNGEGKSPSVTFEVDTEPPAVAIAAPPSPSKNTTPTFTGTASEATEVVVHVFEGSTEVDSAQTTAAGGKWSVALAKALPEGKHSFTAYATEKSGIGNLEGQSTTVGLEVDTLPPVVALTEGPPVRSSKLVPSFAGTASEETEVVVHVFEGPNEIAKASATASNGVWKTTTLSQALPSGKHSFTAYATEKSGLGNKDGSSNSVNFEVDTVPPTVTIEKPASPSDDTTPSFSGEAGEEGEVVVHVLLGSTELETAHATVSNGKWSSAPLGKALPEGRHTFTAYATEKSAIGNKEGSSSTVSFEVDTEPPAVTILAPLSPSRNTTPSFSGTAGEPTEVTVHILEGSTEVDSASTTAAAGKWSLTLTNALASGKHSYTAYATEKSGLGNADGESAPVGFIVNTNPPAVTIVAPLSPSRNTAPSFSGSASEETEVTVHVFEGTTEVDSGSTTAAAGKWSAALAKALPEGKRSFTAYATEKSGLGNANGESAPVGFVVNTEPPVVTIAQPPSPSSNTTPSFSGTASENTEVVVHVLEGSTEVAKASSTAAGGKWSTSTLTKVLAKGKHTFKAYATEKSGLGNPEGLSSEVPFEVNTEAPKVTIEAPAADSNVTTPTFSGTASEETQVTVHVLEGGIEVVSAPTTAAVGRWSVTLNKPLSSGKHDFTAYATEASGLGNAEGRSPTEPAFEVNTLPPVVTITAPISPSNVTTPSFSGAASETTEVTVHVLEGGSEVASASTTAAGGKWSVTLAKALTPGKHALTAYATEKSALGNPDGKSGEVPFEVNTLPPVVTIEGPPSPSNNLKPSFSGTASEETEVTVRVFEGTTEVDSGSTTAAAGKWSLTLAIALSTGKHSFTASVSEKSAIGNKEGSGGPADFEVNTLPPVVTITAPLSPSNNTTPTFQGTASEATEVTVHVFEGSTEVAKQSVTAAAGKWSLTLGKALAGGEHSFTASATEKSGLGNKEGESPSRADFVVNTNPPSVTVSVPAPLRSNNTTPSFMGTASEATEVTVHIFEGTTEVDSASTTAASDKWSLTLTKPLPEGKHEYTVSASEKSGLGNKEGTSPTQPAFEVDTEPPEVGLEAPLEDSNETRPSFSGTASETQPVVVEVFKGAKAEGTAVAKLLAEVSGGKWSTARTSTLGNGKYTVIASEVSSIGNKPGYSSPAVFEVNTEVPKVEIQPLSPSNKTKPVFSGSVDGPADSPVTVYVHEGETAEGTIVAKVTAPISGGKWTSAPLPALPVGKHVYTAVAAAQSSIGNGIGLSKPTRFLVDTEPPTVTITQPASPSNKTTPVFTGTASEATAVTVEVHAGATTMGPVVARATATAKAGLWSAGPATPALADGEYTAVAVETSGIENGPGTSGSVRFVIDTKSPKVTLDALPTPSSDRVPSFSGTATDSEPVTIEIFEGTSTKPEGTPVESVVASEITEGEWNSAPLAKPLEWGDYVALAVEPSSIGNPEGRSEAIPFVVERIPPAVETGGSAAVGRSSAELLGAANPKAAPVTSCNFEVGTTTAYGRTIGCGFISGALAFPVPAATGFVPLFIRIYGLRPGTTYHYRVVAANEGGTAVGADRTFTTLSEPVLPKQTNQEPTPTVEVAGLYAAQLKPAGKGSLIGALLHNGLYAQSFKAPEAGTAAISWYYLPPGAKLAGGAKKKRKPAPILVASGRVTVTAAGQATIKIRLTSAGRRLLKHAKQIELTDTVAFTPAGAGTVTTSGTFRLHR